MTATSTAGRPRIGLALGSGSARGWAHIGVIRALAEAGVEPDIVTGTSIGALVGALYVHGHLDAMESWVLKLTRRDVFSYMDLGISGGGFMEGRRLMELYRRAFGDTRIEDLPKPFAAVATNLRTGQEVWLQKGSVIEAVRASISLPGLFRPVMVGRNLLVDGGLVNPVPVTVCRALGAQVVIAVNLNGDLVGRHFKLREQAAAAAADEPSEAGWFGKLGLPFRSQGDKKPNASAGPGFIEVLASSLNIMQDRITRSRMAGDPPDIVISPRLAHFELLDFSRAEEAIREGKNAVRRMLPLIQDALGLAERDNVAELEG